MTVCGDYLDLAQNCRMNGIIIEFAILFFAVFTIEKALALPDLEISISILHLLLSLNWNCTSVFFFKVGDFVSPGSWCETPNF